MKENNEVKKPKTVMNIRIDDNLKREFRIETLKRGTTMSEVLMNYIEEYLSK